MSDEAKNGLGAGAIEAFVRDHLRKMTSDDADLSPSRPLDELGIDEIDKTELLMELEDRFNIDFEHDAINGWSTIDKIVEATMALLPAEEGA